MRTGIVGWRTDRSSGWTSSWANGGDALAEGAARLGYGQGDIAVEALVGTAFQARPDQMTTIDVSVRS